MVVDTDIGGKYTELLQAEPLQHLLNKVYNQHSNQFRVSTTNVDDFTKKDRAKIIEEVGVRGDFPTIAGRLGLPSDYCLEMYVLSRSSSDSKLGEAQIRQNTVECPKGGYSLRTPAELSSVMNIIIHETGKFFSNIYIFFF